MMDRAKIVGLVVTPETCLSRASTARLPLISLSRLRSSSQIDTPAARSLASESVIGSSEIVVACVSGPGAGGGGRRAGGRGGQLRPAMTPPSTFQIAPVTQLVAGESRKVMVLARSRAV